MQERPTENTSLNTIQKVAVFATLFEPRPVNFRAKKSVRLDSVYIDEVLLFSDVQFSEEIQGYKNRKKGNGVSIFQIFFSSCALFHLSRVKNLTRKKVGGGCKKRISGVAKNL